MLLVSTKNHDLRERLDKGRRQLTFDTGKRPRLQSRPPEAAPRQQKMGHRPTARNAPARHNHEITDKYREHVRAARMLCRGHLPTWRRNRRKIAGRPAARAFSS